MAIYMYLYTQDCSRQNNIDLLLVLVHNTPVYIHLPIITLLCHNSLIQVRYNDSLFRKEYLKKRNKKENKKKGVEGHL